MENWTSFECRTNHNKFLSNYISFKLQEDPYAMEMPRGQNAYLNFSIIDLC